MTADVQPAPEGGDLELAQTFAELAHTLLAEKTLPATLTKMCQLAVATIDGCDHAGVTLIEGQRLTTRGASDDVPKRVDAIQYEVNEGPCLSAIREHGAFQTDDLAEESRWPRFAQRAVEETGVRSVLSIRLSVAGDTMGAIGHFSKQTGAFDDEACAVAGIFAAHAAVALAAAKDHQEMEEAVRSRDVIGQAKGILMARQAITEEQAFDLLKRASQRLNIKLRDVAQAISKGKGPPGASDADSQSR